MGQMKKDYQGFRDRKATIAVIAPHGSEKVRSYWHKESLPFIGIPDPDGRLGQLYGQEWSLVKLGRMPALFIVDQKGAVVFSSYAKNMADIPENEQLWQLLERNAQ
ncbi:MAG TPA: redoxin domain-containing protein [Syntrophales bacterium]|nr:redoxin domain-containing protein [Syntrophales bacterium]